MQELIISENNKKLSKSLIKSKKLRIFNIDNNTHCAL